MKNPVTALLFTLCVGLCASSAQASSCDDRAAFSFDSEVRDKQEAQCAQRAMTHSKMSFGDAIREKEKGEFEAMCRSLSAAVWTLEKYRKVSWRNNSNYWEIAQGVDSNYSTILESFLSTTCKQRVTYYKERAALGETWAIRNLGVLHRDGEILPQDFAEAMRYFKEAAEKGSSNALVNIGLLHEKGQGVPKSDSEAFSWYMKAAILENSDGEYNLGIMYLYGRGVTQDFEEAAKWFRLAKKHGDEDAEGQLEAMYEAGQAKKPFFSFW